MPGEPSTKPLEIPAPRAEVLIVGAGPVGMRVARELHRLNHEVTVLSAESLPPYNRVRLTPLLGGDAQFGEITLDAPTADTEGFDLQVGRRVARIDRVEKQVITADGGIWDYETLVLATGSRAFVPNIPGKDLPGVYTFRTADDAAALLARSFSARRVAVIGGGLLGLEAARGMRRRQCEVSVVEHESNLMPRQLDQRGGDRLATQIEELGVGVLTGGAVRQIMGTHRVEGLQLANGQQVDCDTVIICTGVRPNIDLARDAKLAFNRGIIVNDQMQTSAPDIYAVGECVEHAGQVYGLVGPGFAQAEVAAAVINSASGAFEGAAPATKLKVIGVDVFSVGPIEQLEADAAARSHIWEDAGAYRRIFLRNGHLVGALSVGPWEQSGQVQDAVQRNQTVYPWMLFRFRKTGLLWAEADLSVTDMPDSAILCNCTGVTCGQVRSAISDGCGSVAAVGEQTGAGTVCGSCHAMTEELLDGTAAPAPVRFWKPLIGLSVGAGLISLYPVLVGSIPLPTGYDADSLRDWLWRDNIVKQWSGFILLGLTVAAFLIGMRKRMSFMDKLGRFEYWRFIHLGIGVAAIIGFVAHTGFSIGSGWNRALGMTFLIVLLLGAVAGAATGGDHELRARQIGSPRKPPRHFPVWGHILALWPLPALILWHVFASYAF